MYTITLITAKSKPTDLKICSKCNSLNWHENEECAICASLCIEPVSKSFKTPGEGVLEAIEEDYTFYMTEEGMSEAEANQALISI